MRAYSSRWLVLCCTCASTATCSVMASSSQCPTATSNLFPDRVSRRPQSEDKVGTLAIAKAIYEIPVWFLGTAVQESAGSGSNNTDLSTEKGLGVYA